MTLIEVHDRVLSLIDQIRSGLIHPAMLDEAINTAVSSIYDNKVGWEGNSSQPIFYPEVTQRMRDNLAFYFESKETAHISGDFNYRTSVTNPLALLLSVEIKSAGLYYNPTPIHNKDKQVIKQNSFTVPRNDTGAWTLAYASFIGDSIQFLLPPSFVITHVKIGYLRVPIALKYGKLYNPGDLTTDGLIVSAYSPRVIYNGQVYLKGVEFTATTAALFTSGQIISGYSVPDIDPLIESKVFTMAADILQKIRLGNIHQKQ